MTNATADAAVRAIVDIIDRGGFTPKEVEEIFGMIRYELSNNFILYRERAEKEEHNDA